MSNAVVATAAAVSRAARERGLTKGNEQSHLAPCFRDVLANAATSTPFRVALPGERRRGDRPEWPGVGDVDALVAGPGGLAWVELKCGSGHQALCACEWDALKPALALRTGRARQAYLLGATTVTHWRDGIRGAEFLGALRVERTVDNRRRFADWWRHWERRRDPLPVRLPAAYATDLVERTTFAVGPTEYELRLARVTVAGEQDYIWEPFLAPERRGRTR